MAAHWITLTDTVPPEWWVPLERLIARVGDDDTLPPIDIDDYLYAAWTHPEKQPYIHLYRNVLTGRYLNVDDQGHLWVFAGRSKECPEGYRRAASLEEAIGRADLVRAEQLAAHTHRGARRPGWIPPGTVPPAEETSGTPEEPAATQPSPILGSTPWVVGAGRPPDGATVEAAPEGAGASEGAPPSDAGASEGDEAGPDLEEECVSA
jgi:hypothetical protein